MSSADQFAIQETNEKFQGQNENESLYDGLAMVTADITNTGEWTGSEVAQLVSDFVLRISRMLLLIE